LQRLKKIFSATAAAVAVLTLALLVALWAKPPDLLRIGAAYAAKIVCSNVFLADRDPAEVLRDDVQAPGIWLLSLVRVSVDREHGAVRAGFLGFIGHGLAVARPGGGCAVWPDGKLGALKAYEPTPTPLPSEAAARDQPWPDGNASDIDPDLDRLIADDALTGAGTRAVLVVHHGKLVAERYDEGFGAETPQLGWSMTKSVTAALIGIAIKEGRIALNQRALWTAGDGRENIKLADLMSMTSGLRFNEGYGAVSDVTRMLFLEPDMAAFARAQPLDHPPGTSWSYSSGTAVILARIFQESAGPAALSWVHERLFDPLGMTSAVIETDAHGTLVGSSYMYATARDWARYGQFLLQQGTWHGQEILPPGFVTLMTTPAPASRGQYGQGQVWLWGSDAATPGQNPDRAFGIPADCFWMEGHDGQFVAIIPSRAVVIVRLGLTPAREHYRPQPLVRALLGALPKP
jgi:CubicO group peptidase (beta-lactamase class C family)